MVPLKLQSLILGLAVHFPGDVHLHRVVYDQVRGALRVDMLRISSQSLHSVPHSSEVHHSRNPGEVLQHNSAGQEGNLDTLPSSLSLRPVEDLLDVGLQNLELITIPDCGLQQNLYGERKGFILLSQSW